MGPTPFVVHPKFVAMVTTKIVPDFQCLLSIQWSPILTHADRARVGEAFGMETGSEASIGKLCLPLRRTMISRLNAECRRSTEYANANYFRQAMQSGSGNIHAGGTQVAHLVAAIAKRTDSGCPLLEWPS